MKVYLLYENYYDYCDLWPTLLGIYDSEEKAITAQIVEEEKEQYKNTEKFSTCIEEWELL